ncbi:MAG: ATP-binding cassette domain-containing protein, partial [Candidatus Methylomirabilales bacterium]
LRNVEVRYGDRKVLTIESLAITPRTTTAVMGPNGAGKTTLLKLLAGLVDTTNGVLNYRGDQVTPDSVTRLRQKVCLVHQVPLLFNATVLENIAFGLKARGISKAEIQRAVSQALSLVGCSDLKKRRARELSGGEVKRVAIARALVLDPEVLLLDEPLANVDQITAKALEEVFQAIEERGQTLIFSTHDARLAHRLAHEVVVLMDGRLSPSPYENLFAGHLLIDGETAWFDTGKARIAVPPGMSDTGHISIGPDEILLSRQPLQSSARNVFQGRLIRIEERGEGVLDVAVEAGEPFTVRLTQQSFLDLGLSIGAQVYLTFKSTAVTPL